MKEHEKAIKKLRDANALIDEQTKVLRKYIKTAEKNMEPVLHIMYTTGMVGKTYTYGMQYGTHEIMQEKEIDDMFKHIWFTRQTLYSLIARWDENQGEISRIEHEHNVRGITIANKIGILEDEATVPEA